MKVALAILWVVLEVAVILELCMVRICVVHEFVDHSSESLMTQVVLGCAGSQDLEQLASASVRH